jgi:teichuronic acid biosynthesis glycosyltransferase TuaG
MTAVSVIIPMYNRTALLKETLDSVLAQTFTDYEIIVVDDGSTEPIDTLIEEYKGKATFIKAAHTGLPAVGRNIGIRISKGEYIAFLDSDDIWLPNKLKVQVQELTGHPMIALTCSDAYILKDIVTKCYFPNRYGQTGYLLDELITDNFVITSTCMVRRDVLINEGGFSGDKLYKGIEDYELWIRIAKKYQIQYMSDALAMYRDADASLRSELSRTEYHKGLDMIYRTAQVGLPDAARDRVIWRRIRNIWEWLRT